MDSKTQPKKPKSRKALNAPNLEHLGGERLAAILIELAEDSTFIKRRLRMELAARAGPEDLAAEIRKPLETLKIARGRVHWRKLKALCQDLDLLLGMISGPLAEADPAGALPLLLDFIALERVTLDRVKDVKGDVAAIFAVALGRLTDIASGVAGLPPNFTTVLTAALAEASAGAMGPIVEAIVPALNPESVGQLRALIEAEMAPHRRINAGWRAALQAVLDAQGDAAAYAATYSASEAVLPPIGARIAARFLKAGQLDEAAAALDRSNPFVDAAGQPAKPFAATGDAGARAWQGVRIDLLEAKGEAKGAQDERWAAFERDLSAEHLRAYLRRLDGFDDVVATDRALEHAQTFRPFGRALSFLVAWPALKEAAALVMDRTAELLTAEIDDLEPAVRALEGRFPLAATLVLRAMIRDVVRYGQVDLYPRARVWLLEAASLAGQIDDFGEHRDHAAFVMRHAPSLQR